MLLALLNLLDLFFTFILLGLGATELNPVARSIFDTSILAALAYKVMPGAAGFGLWWFSDRSARASKALRWLVGLYSFIVAYQVVSIILA